MIEGSCHCGAIRYEIDAELPETLTSCNCSICRRYGSLMAYFSPENVKVTADPGKLAEYIWGDKQLAFVRCGDCGCFGHWRGLAGVSPNRMGVNARLFTNVDIAAIRVRRFDGADTWAFLD